MTDESKRVDIREILNNPEFRKELMIDCMIAAREVADLPPLSREEAAEIYDKLQEEKHKRRLK